MNSKEPCGTLRIILAWYKAKKKSNFLKKLSNNHQKRSTTGYYLLTYFKKAEAFCILRALVKNKFPESQREDQW